MEEQKAKAKMDEVLKAAGVNKGLGLFLEADGTMQLVQLNLNHAEQLGFSRMIENLLAQNISFNKR